MTIVLPPTEPKATQTWDRSVPFAQTLALVPRLRERFGITRVGDTTWLDRTGVPTFCAVVPATLDLISVYNGKGLTREAAMLSAVMEAVERQLGAQPPLEPFDHPIADVRAHLRLDVLELLSEIPAIVPCVHGTDLLSGKGVVVPLAMVQCPWFGARLFRFTSTNGLASGNTLTEAIYHALCELIERHTWSLYQAACNLLPRLYQGRNAEDVALAQEVIFPTGDATIDALFEQITRVGLEVRARYLDAGSLPATMIATVTDLHADPPMAHMGLGCSLAPAHALARALTECVQSRVVDIQAAREDILRPDEPAGITGSHARRVTSLPVRQWYHDLPAASVRLTDIEDRASDDVARDLQCTLASMRDAGLAQAVVVDLSPGDIPVHVVRAIVPRCETFAINGRIGPYIREIVNPFRVRTSRGALTET